MTAAFEELRSLGMKAIVRYSYVVCEKKISKTKTEFEFQEDAKKDQLLAHIKQVTPILKVTFISKWIHFVISLNSNMKSLDY